MSGSGPTHDDSASTPSGTRAAKTWLTWVLSAFGAVGLAWLAARKLPLWPERWAAVDPTWLWLALGSSVPYAFARAHRMGYLLHPLVQTSGERGRVRASLVHGSGLLSFFVIFALPLRLGELSRPVLLARAGAPGLGLEAGIGAQATERVVDGLCVVGLLFLGLALSEPAHEGLDGLQTVTQIGRITAWVFLGLTLLGLAVVRVPGRVDRWVRLLLPRAWGERLAPPFERIAAAFQALFRLRAGVPFVLWTLVYWGVTVLQFWALARAFGLSFASQAGPELWSGLGAAAAGVAIVGLSIQLPGGPAQLGSFQVGMASALALYLPAAEIAGGGASFAVAMYLLSIGTAALGVLPALFLLARARRVGPLIGASA